MIRFEQVGKRYPNGHVGLHEISFRVHRGEIMFVTGHSGAGKSTLLRLILAMERPTSGKLLLGGQDVSRISTAQIPFLRRQIGVVFQNHQLLDDRSVFDNVALPMQILGLPKAEIAYRVEAALERVNLKEKAEDRPSDLSTGQQQRVGIARAVAMEPKVLLLDEITSALDPELVGEVLAVVQELAAEGRTMILVTHEMAFAQEVADRVVFTDQGRIVIDAPPAKVFGEQPHERLRAFLSRFVGFRPNPA